MSLDVLAKEIIKEAEKSVEEIKSEALREKKRILKEAEEKKEQLLSNAQKNIDTIIASEEKEKLSSVQLEAKKSLNEAKESAVINSLDVLWQDFVSLRSGKNYSEILSKLAKQGVKEIGSNAVVKVNSKDAKLLKGSFNLSKESVDISGGVIVTSADGRIIVNNSFEALFESKTDDLKKELFKELF
ncbi:MAG: V-type ATP synthase subunit E [Candidatus Diapherotrites archaeon]|nr:V-type ATP synthase subunit E [Candidatus Diapherotrites archaeon]